MTRLEFLIARHQELDDEVDTMAERRYLSSTEHDRMRELKVMRLRCRDTIRKLKLQLEMDGN